MQALARLGLRDGLTILEVGSGPGFVTEALLDRLPAAAVTAVDLDPAMNELARARLSGHLGHRLEIVDASILNTNLQEESFDFAIARYVFQHLNAPDFAAQEIFHLLRPGAVLAILDVDDDLGGLVSPFKPAFAATAYKVQQVQAMRAGNRHIGRKLWRLLAGAGFEDLALDMVAFHSHELGIEPFLPQYTPERFRPFVIPGGLTEAEWEQYRDAYTELIAAPDAFILQIMFLVSGRRPHSELAGEPQP